MHLDFSLLFCRWTLSFYSLSLFCVCGFETVLTSSYLYYAYAASIPDSVKAELLQRIRTFLVSAAHWCISYMYNSRGCSFMRSRRRFSWHVYWLICHLRPKAVVRWLPTHVWEDKELNCCMPHKFEEVHLSVILKFWTIMLVRIINFMSVSCPHQSKPGTLPIPLVVF